MSIGEDRVRLNPSEDPLVNQIKKKTAELIDLCEEHRKQSGPGERQRLFSLAMTAYEEASMWGVKGFTYKV